LTTLDEPIAAFLDHVNTTPPQTLSLGPVPRHLLVVDFGGGTCDVAIFAVSRPIDTGPIRIAPLAVSRYHRLGGGDIDAAVLYEVLLPQLVEQNGLDRFELGFSDKKQVLEPSLIGLAESLKIGICDHIARLKSFGKYEGADKTQFIKKQPGVHTIKLHGRDLRFTTPQITAAQFEQLLEPFLDVDLLYARSTEYRLTCSIFAPIEDALNRAGLARAEIDLVLLAGGSSRIPQVAERLSEYLPESRLLSFAERDQSQTAIARGAALHALSLTLTGEGLVTPVAHDRIAIRTATSNVELITRGTSLPFPQTGISTVRLAAPETSENYPVDLRIEVIAGDEERLLMRETWTLNPPVTKGERLIMSYALDADQVLSLEMSRLDAGRARPFTGVIENPLTNVVNPNRVEAEIEAIETALRKGEIASKTMHEHFIKLADKYAELGQVEKAIEYVKRVVRQRNAPDAYLLNRLAGLHVRLGDNDRSARLYREAAAAAPSWGGPLFNLALDFRRLKRFTEALSEVRAGISREDNPAYRMLEALLLDDLGQTVARDTILADHRHRFGSVRTLSDWELGWHVTGCQLSGDEAGARVAEAERSRRRLSEDAQTTSGLLPESVQGV
jgi:molecular chaperone DnaK (HSP70)